MGASGANALMDKWSAGQHPWRRTRVTIAAETSLAEEQQHADSSVGTDPVDLELWTYRLEAIAQTRAEGVDVTRWAGDGTLRTRDNITGHDVVREGGSPMQDYREVTEPCSALDVRFVGAGSEVSGSTGSVEQAHSRGSWTA